MLPKGFCRGNLVADSYFIVTVKGAQQTKERMVQKSQLNLRNQTFQESLRSSYRMERIKNE